MSKLLKLGTRRSLLALSQSRQVARSIEVANPGTRVELVGIETRGDRILDVPLSKVEGKEFFVAEIDDALKEGRVDLTVHSFKDLSLHRPVELMLAAVPKRAEPRDAIVFAPGIQAKLQRGEKIRIGTSSPRRIENIPRFLSRALPDPKGEIELVEIRGNVNTRLSRLSAPASSGLALDGVVLAMAGLSRLWADRAAQAEITPLLRGTRWMLMPLRECAAAPAQGALAVECRAGDEETLLRVRRIHDESSLASVTRERAWLERWGGGCHQKFGATHVSHPELAGGLLFMAGRSPDGNLCDRVEWATPPSPQGSLRPWLGTQWRKQTQHATSVQETALTGAVFVSHSRAWNGSWPSQDLRVWTSGTSSWFDLAAKGVWVEGSAEGLGHEWIRGLLAEPILGLPPESQWKILTHEGARSDWPGRSVISSYSIKDLEYSADAIRSLKEATHVFWSSASQRQALGSHLAPGAHESCGAGKSAESLRRNGVQATVFPSSEEWKKWLRITS